ncbi:hypothetical protein Tco_0547684 [Tanacetum coccineum]
MSVWETIKEQVAKLARNVEQMQRQNLYGQYSCSCCGGPQNGGNCPGCSMVCGGPRYSSDCQTRNPLVYEHNTCNNYDLPHFDQPSQYHVDQSPPQDLDLKKSVDDMKFQLNEIIELILRRQMPNPTVNLIDTKKSDDDTEVIFDEEQFLRQQSTARVIPSSLVDTPPFPRLDVLGGETFDVDSPFGEHLDTLSMRDMEIDFNPSDIETNNPVPDLRMFNVPLGNDDSISRSFSVTISNPLFEFDDNFTLRVDNKIVDEEFEDLCSLDAP